MFSHPKTSVFVIKATNRHTLLTAGSTLLRISVTGFTQKLGKIKFNDFYMTNQNFPRLKNAENPAIWGIFLLDDMENVSSFQTARNIWTKK